VWAIVDFRMKIIGRKPYVVQERSNRKKCFLENIFFCDSSDDFDVTLQCNHHGHTECLSSYIRNQIQLRLHKAVENSQIVCPQCDHALTIEEVGALVRRHKNSLTQELFDSFMMLSAQNTVVVADIANTAAHEKLVTCISCQGMYLVDTALTSFVTCVNSACNTRFCVDVSKATTISSYFLLYYCCVL